MSIKLNQKDLNKLLKKNNIEKEQIKKPKRTNVDRLSDAIDLLTCYDNEDRISFNKDFSKCLIEITNITLLSNNDSLRLGARKMLKYKKLWHERIQKIINKDILNKWKASKEEKIVIEFLYEVSTNHFMDYDGRMGAFKAPLDGLIEAKLIHDDKEEFVPVIFGRQRVSKNKIQNLKIILSVEKEPDRFYSKDFLDMIYN